MNRISVALTHVRPQDILQHRIKRPQHFVMSDYQVRLCAEGVEYARELDSDVSRTNYDHTFRLLLDIEEPIRVDPIFGPRDHVVRGDSWTTSDGDGDLLRFDLVSRPIEGFDLECVRVDKSGETFVVIDFVVGEIFLTAAPLSASWRKPSRREKNPLDPVEALDVGVPLVFERGPVEFGHHLSRRIFVAETVCSGLADVVGDIGGVPGG